MSSILREAAARRSSHTLVEEEARRSSHTLVEEEGQDVMPAAPFNVETLTAKRGLVTSKLQEVQSARMQLRNHRQAWTKQRYQILDLEDEFSTSMKKAMRSTKAFKSAWPALQELRETIEAEQDKFDVEEEKTKMLVNVVSELELRHCEEEEDLCRSIDSHVSLLTTRSSLNSKRRSAARRLSADLQVSNDGERRTSSQVPGIPSISNMAPGTAFPVPRHRDLVLPPILSKYNDRVGDVTIFQERLMELDADYNAEATRRENRANLGEPIAPSDLEFQDSYHQEQDGMRQQLSVAMADVQRLRQECLDAEIDPDKQNDKHKPSFPTTWDTLLTTDVSQTLRPPALRRTAFDTIYSETSGFGRVNTGFMTSKERINLWLDHIAKIEGFGRSLYQNTAGLSTSPGTPPTPHDEDFGLREENTNSDAAQIMQLSQKTSIGEPSAQGVSSPRPPHSWNGEAPSRRYSDSGLQGDDTGKMERGWSSAIHLMPTSTATRVFARFNEVP